MHTDLTTTSAWAHSILGEQTIVAEAEGAR